MSRYTRQPQGTFPKLRREFADAVFVYLPSVGLAQAKSHRLSIASGTLPTASQRFGSTLAAFDAASALQASGTTGLNFSAMGFTVLAAGAYFENIGGVVVKSLINRRDAGTAGGFNVNLFNVYGGGGNVFASYNHPTTGDTNFDSFYVNGVKAASGNGNPSTSVGVRYVCAGTAAVGPASSVNEIQIGRDPGANSEAAVEFLIIWPRKMNEALLRQITSDPYIVFQRPDKLVVVDAPAGGVSSADAVAAAGSATVSATAASLRATAAIAAAGTATVSATTAQTRAASATPAAGIATVGGAGASTAASTATPADGTATVSATSSYSEIVTTTAVPAAGMAFVSATTPSDIDYAAIAAAVWGYLLPNGKTAQQSFVEMHAVLTGPVEGVVDLSGALRVLLAVAAGKTTITPTAPDQAIVEFQAIDDSVTRVTAEMDGSERVNVTIDAGV